VIGLLLLIRWIGGVARLGVGLSSTTWSWEFEAKSSLEAAFTSDTLLDRVDVGGEKGRIT
jgi:hypothetical protein